MDSIVSLAERRSLRRFELMAPVLYRWKDEADRFDVGCCRNVSAAGIFVLTTHCPPLHTEIDVELVLPAFDPSTTEVRLRCIARVVRIQARDEVGDFGFAAAGSF